MISGNQFKSFANKISVLGGEIGGKIFLNEDGYSIIHLPNFSDNKKQFITDIPFEELNDQNLAGFWHTHHFKSFPSPQDLFQMIKLNLMFKRKFLMVIFGKRKISITEFKFFVFPKIRFEKIKTV